MMIRRVSLTNVLSHENTEVSFSDGVVSIVGPNGAGKSSIIDAVYLALLVDGKPDVRGGKTEFIVTRGRRSGKISVLLEVGGKEYLVVRELDARGSSQAYLYEVYGEHRKLRASGVTAVVSEVGRLFGLPTYASSELRKLVRATIFSLQDELTQIIDIEDSKRREWILSLLGLSYLEKALDSVKGVVRDERSRLEGELGGKEKVLRETKSSLERVKKELSDMEAKLRAVLEEKSRVDGEMRRIEEELKLIDVAVDTALELKTALVFRRLEELESRTRQLRALKDWGPDLYSQLLREVSRWSWNLREVDERLRDFLGKVEKTLGVPADKLEELRSGIEREINALREQEGGYKKHLELLKDVLVKFKLGERCPVCGSRISDPERVRAHLEEEISDIEKSLERVREGLRVLEEKRRLVDGALRELPVLFSERERAEENLRNKEEELEQLKKRAEEMCRLAGIVFREVDECALSLGILREEVGRAEVELETLRRQVQEGLRRAVSTQPEELVERLTSVLTTLGIQPPPSLSLEQVDRVVNVELRELRRKLESKLREVRERSSSLSSEVGRLIGSIESMKKNVEDMERAVAELEGGVRELERKIRALRLLEDFGARYLGKDGEIAKSWTKAVRARLEKKANQILSKLELPNITINDEFQIFVKVPEGEVPIKNASGGERVGISIALRLALAELIMGKSPTTLILDEPTVYLDSEKRESVFDIIRELGKSLRQLIVVTHDDTVVNISNKVIRVEKIGGVSEVSEVD